MDLTDGWMVQGHCWQAKHLRELQLHDNRPRVCEMKCYWPFPAGIAAAAAAVGANKNFDIAAAVVVDEVFPPSHPGQ